MMFSQLLENCDGQRFGADFNVEGVSTDTRTLKPGDLFVALSGENFNANDFVDVAIKKGAKAAVVSRSLSESEFPHVLVGDTLQTLQNMAANKRRYLQAKVVAITGSCGKTSVKGMLAAILSECGGSHSTAGNYNNHIGVPLTLLNAPDLTEYLVVEAGTSSPGEILSLAHLIRPHVAVVTNVHAAHIGGFGSLEAIAMEKADIYQGATDTLAIINSALLGYSSFERNLNKNSIVFSVQGDAEGRANVIATEVSKSDAGSCKFRVQYRSESFEVSLSVLGEHQVENAMAAISCAVALDASIASIQSGLRKYRGDKGRMELKNWRGGILVDDSYNANPGSMRAAIDYLRGLKNTALVLGDMAELGECAAKAHYDVGSYARRAGISYLFVTGNFSQEYAEGYGNNTVICDSREAIVEKLNAIKAPCNVLVKGSRSAGMEKIANSLLMSGKN